MFSREDGSAYIYHSYLRHRIQRLRRSRPSSTRGSNCGTAPARRCPRAATGTTLIYMWYSCPWNRCRWWAGISRWCTFSFYSNLLFTNRYIILVLPVPLSPNNTILYVFLPSVELVIEVLIPCRVEFANILFEVYYKNLNTELHYIIHI